MLRLGYHLLLRFLLGELLFVVVDHFARLPGADVPALYRERGARAQLQSPAREAMELLRGIYGENTYLHHGGQANSNHCVWFLGLYIRLVFSVFFWFLSRPSSALISWSSTQVLVDHWGTFCAGGYPNVHFFVFPTRWLWWGLNPRPSDYQADVLPPDHPAPSVRFHYCTSIHYSLSVHSAYLSNY